MGDWTRLYGPQGFVQYQCVVPGAPAAGPIRTIFERIARSGEPALARRAQAIRRGPLARHALLPREGTTLAVDFAVRGDRPFALLDDLDAIVREAGGAVYPAKDARMSPESFRAFFPELDSIPSAPATPSSPPRSGDGCMPPERPIRVLVVGATSAIATETARIYATYGARLFLAARNADRLQAVAADLRTRGAGG